MNISEHNIILPSKPRVVSEKDTKGVYEIDNLAPGYGHTLGNSLRRIILASLPGVAITSLKIDGISHEFSVINGIKEDVIIILLNLKKVRFKMLTDEPQKVNLVVKGKKIVTAADIIVPSQVEVLNKDLYLAELTDKNASLNIEMNIESGLGFVSKEDLQKGKIDIGTIAIDAIFTPIRRAKYEVENMRVGDRTDHNRLRIIIETDGTITPREAMERSIEIMITQLKAVIGFKEKEEDSASENEFILADNQSGGLSSSEDSGEISSSEEDYSEALKTRIDNLNFSTRTFNALTTANIRTVGGIARKKKEDLLELKGLGNKGIQEIKRVLGDYGIILK